MRRVTYSHGMADDNCNVDISRHALDKHERDVAKYVGQEFLHILRRCVEIIFKQGRPHPASERWRHVERERRVAVVKFRGKTLRVVIAKTDVCYLVITAHPYGGRPYDVDCDM